MAGIALAVKWAADQVGGFGNLWDLTWQGIQLGFVGYALAILTPLGWIIDAINALISGANALGGALGIDAEIGQINNPIDDLRDNFNERRDRFSETFTTYREEVRVREQMEAMTGGATPQTPEQQAAQAMNPVSYTHLTLPTISSV